MIELQKKTDCCGCAGCVQRCPKHCIQMKEDGEGFLYPEVDKTVCIDCGLCEKVCPVINQSVPRKPIHVYAAKNNDEDIRQKSSSGGVFTLLAEATIEKGGIVFGAGFDKHWDIVHSFTETKEGLACFRGSKYVQSRIGESYLQAEKFLKEGRNVLFSGTPCQIAGLKKFLRREYENLLTVDFICHGVPSPGVWREYLNKLCEQVQIDKVQLTSFSFRDKTTSWKRYHIHCTYKGGFFDEPASRNLYMRGFLSDLYIRPSCYDCPSKCLKSGSDITLGDFWGIERVLPAMDDDKGIGAVLTNSSKVHDLLASLSYESKEIMYQNVLLSNPSLGQSAKPHLRRDYFFANYKNELLFSLISRLTKRTIAQKIKTRLIYIARLTGLQPFFKTKIK